MLYNFIMKLVMHTQLDFRVFTEQKSVLNVVYNSLYIIHLVETFYNKKQVMSLIWLFFCPDIFYKEYIIMIKNIK